MHHFKRELTLLSKLSTRDISTILLTVGLILVFFIPSDHLSVNHTSYCIHKYLLNFDCPGCGMTRALNQLLHGQFRQAIFFNIGVIPLMVFIIQQYSSYFLASKSNALFRKFSFQFLTSTLLIIYINRVVQHLG
jgi:hypothetical protein